MTYFIHGYYGLGNIGDEIMLHALIKGILGQDKEASFIIGMARNGKESHLYLPEGCAYEATTFSSFSELKAAIGRCDKVIFGGGTCLHEGGFCGFMANIVGFLWGKKVYLLGIGVSPVRSLGSRIKARITTFCAHRITVRDEKSYKWARKLTLNKRKIHLTEDMAYLFNITSSDPTDEKILLLSWRNPARYISPAELEGAMEKITFLSKRLIQEKYVDKCVVLSVADSADAEVNRRFANMLKDSGVVNEVILNSSVEEKIQYINQSTFFFSVRLHGLFIAKKKGKASFGYNYAPKIKAFSDVLSQDVLFDQEQSIDELYKRVVEEIKSPAYITDMEQRVEKAKQNVELLFH